MSLRPKKASPRRDRLDRVLHAGLNETDRRHKEQPTGVLGPFLAGVPARRQDYANPPSAPTPYFPSNPRDSEPGSYRSKAIFRDNARDQPMAIKFGEGGFNGKYTGDLVNGVPEGTGELIMRDERLESPYHKLEARAAKLATSGASADALREARATVEAEAQIPDAAYDRAWKDIKSFAREKKKDVDINLLVKWGRDNREKWDLFGANVDTPLNAFRDDFMFPLLTAADASPADAVMTTSEFKNGVAAFRRGELDITADRKRALTGGEVKEWLSGDFEDGRFMQGVMTHHRKDGDYERFSETFLDLSEGVDRQTVIVKLEERRNGKLTQKIVLDKLIGKDDTFRGRILIGSRPSKHKFPGTGPTEQVKMFNGEAKQVGNLEEIYTEGVLSLSGQAQVRVTIEGNGPEGVAARHHGRQPAHRRGDVGRAARGGGAPQPRRRRSHVPHRGVRRRRRAHHTGGLGPRARARNAGARAFQGRLRCRRQPGVCRRGR